MKPFLRTAIVRCIAGACGISFLSVAMAGPIGIANLHTLAQQADAIVVGTVAQGYQSGRNVSFVLSTERVLKGDVETQQSLTVGWTSGSPYDGSRELKGARGVYFLRKPNTGPWQLLPAVAGDALFEMVALPATSVAIAADLRYQDSAPIDEKLLLELAAAIESSDGGILGANYLNGLQTTASPAVMTAYGRFSRSSVPGISAFGIAGLIRQGDANVLSLLLPGASQNRQAPADVVVSSLCQYSNANVQAIQVLGALATNPEADTRLQRCAITALRMIHTKEALPWLELLLDSKNPDIRYEALAGLASFANSGSLVREAPLKVDGVQVARLANVYRSEETLQNFPAVDVFRANESQYIQFWKSWWSGVRSKIETGQ